MNAPLQPGKTAVHYTVDRVRPGWELPEEPLPGSHWHDHVVSLLKAVLEAWAARTPGTLIVRNLAVRWAESAPRVGVDPDVAVLHPAPPNPRELTSLLTWMPGHAPPALAVEVVSQSNPRKDYTLAPEKYSASGVGELWVFDPLLAGPEVFGGPCRLQVWTRTEEGFVRQHAGEGPAFSPCLKAYLVTADEGRELRISEEASGAGLWLTAAEAEREARETERAAKEAALARLAQLEAELGRLKGR